MPRLARQIYRARVLASATLLGLAASTAAVAQDTGARVQWSTLRVTGGEATATDTTGTKRALYLDAELQQAVGLLLARARALGGAVSVVDVATGHVLVATELGDQRAGSLLFDAVAPAASVFKLVTTLALYEHTAVTPASSVCSKGGIRSIDEEHLLPGRGMGVVCSPFGQALGTSRNAAYAQLASRFLAPEELALMSERLGFNRPLVADAAGQVGALTVPSGGLAYARTAAGFENSRLSVLGAAQLALAIADGGWLKPLRFMAPRTDSLPLVEPAPSRLFSARTAERVRRSMEFTVHSGTAHDSFIDENGRRYLGPVQAAGKTGTRKPAPGAPTASWFVGFAPSNKPRVVISVLLQNSELWHQKGHQLARDVLRLYFARLGVSGVTSPLAPSEPLLTAARN